MKRYEIRNNNGDFVTTIKCQEIEVCEQGVYFLVNKLVTAFVPNTFIVKLSYEE